MPEEKAEKIWDRTDTDYVWAYIAARGEKHIIADAREIEELRAAGVHYDDQQCRASGDGCETEARPAQGTEPETPASATAINISSYHKAHFSAHFGRQHLGVEVRRVPDHRDYRHKLTKFPYPDSPIGRKLRMGDLCVLPGAGSTLDRESTALLENHATYIRVLANASAGIRSRLYPADAVEMMPPYLVAICQVIHEVLVRDRVDLIDQWATQLDSPRRAARGDGIRLRAWEMNGFNMMSKRSSAML